LKGPMNEITRKLVVQTARKYPREADRNGDEFLIKLQSAYNDLVVNELVVPLWFRIQSLWKVFHPEHFDGEGFLVNELIEKFLSESVSKIVDRICSRPDLKYILSDYGDLPRQISNPTIPGDVEKFYRAERKWCITYMVENPSVGQDKLAKCLGIKFKPTPPMAAKRIAAYAFSIRTIDQTVGLPLFETTVG